MKKKKGYGVKKEIYLVCAHNPGASTASNCSLQHSNTSFHVLLKGTIKLINLTRSKIVMISIQAVH